MEVVSSFVIYFVFFQFVPIYVLYGLYAAVMNFKRAKDNGMLSKTALMIGYPWFIVGLLLDVYCNIFVMTLWLLELPKLNIGELTVTARLTRLSKEGGNRGDFSRWFCDELLDSLDPDGKHCI